MFFETKMFSTHETFVITDTIVYDFLLMVEMG